MIKIENEIENKEEHKKSFELLFDEKEVANARLSAEQKLAKNIEIKGFRKGKVPLEEARKHINPSSLLNEMADILSNNGYDWLIEQYYDDEANPKKPIDFFIEKPSISIKKLEENSALIDYSFYVLPEISINVDELKSSIEKQPVTDEEIQKRIDQEIEGNSTLEPKGDDAVLEKGDDAVFDFEGSIDGEKFPGGSAKQYELEIGSNRFIPGFEEQMIGMKPGEEKDITVKFPDDYQASTIAGKEAVFHIFLHQIKKIVRPEYNDDFIKTLGIKDVNNDAELRNYVKVEIQKQKDREYEDAVNKEISELLIKDTKISYIPPFLIENENKRIHQELDTTLSQYRIKFDDYLKMINSSKEKLDEDLAAEAKKRVILDFAVSQIAKDKNIAATPEEIQEEIKKLESMYNAKNDPKISERIQEQRPLIAANIMQKKVYEFLYNLLTTKK